MDEPILDPVERQLRDRLARVQRELQERQAAKEAWQQDETTAWRAWLRKAARSPSEKERER